MLDTTRQKKEILKKIDQWAEILYAEEEMGCGFLPQSARDYFCREINSLYEELAKLRHFQGREEMEDFEYSIMVGLYA